tara:strand:+ start:1006 stop:1137 length:132 start_codon:yes stop_codon:yes gene_type:complete
MCFVSLFAVVMWPARKIVLVDQGMGSDTPSGKGNGADDVLLFD